MCLIAGRKQIGGNIPFCGDVGNNLDFFVYVREFCEKLGVRIAFENVLSDFIPSCEGFLQAVGIRVIKQDLCFQDFGRCPSNRLVIAQGQIEKDLDRGTALHM